MTQMREDGIRLQLVGFAELCTQCRLNSETDLGTLGRLHVDPLKIATLSCGCGLSCYGNQYFIWQGHLAMAPLRFG